MSEVQFTFCKISAITLPIVSQFNSFLCNFESFKIFISVVNLFDWFLMSINPESLELIKLTLVLINKTNVWMITSICYVIQFKHISRLRGYIIGWTIMNPMLKVELRNALNLIMNMKCMTAWRSVPRYHACWRHIRQLTGADLSNQGKIKFTLYHIVS